MNKFVFVFFCLTFLTCINGCQADGQERLNAVEFKEKITKSEVNIVDIRTAMEFSTGYISGAQNFDFYNPDFVKAISELDKEKPLAIYCKSGDRTKGAMEMLAKEGFKTIYALKGGLLAWEREGNTLVIPKPIEPVKTKFNKADYEKLVNSEKLVIVEFGAVWCGPCKMLKPVLDKLSGEYASKGVKIVYIDVDDNKELSNQLLVNEIPLLLFYSGGKLKEQMIGFNPENMIKEVIVKYL